MVIDQVKTRIITREPRQQSKVLLPPPTKSFTGAQREFLKFCEPAKALQGWASIAWPLGLLRKRENQQTREKSWRCIRPQADHNDGTLGTLRVWRGSRPHRNSAHEYSHTRPEHTPYTCAHFFNTWQTDTGDWGQRERHLVAWHHQPGSGDIRWVMEHSRARRKWEIRSWRGSYCCWLVSACRGRDVALRGSCFLFVCWMEGRQQM